VPSDIPQIGGNVYTLPGFSLSTEYRSITLPVNMPKFSGEITVGIECSRYEVHAAGTVNFNGEVTRHWKIGPASANYMTPPPFKQWDRLASVPVISPTAF
jgi:hypothetical protein